MPAVVGMGTSVPQNRVAQEHVREFAGGLFDKSLKVERLLPVFENSTVRERYFCQEAPWYQQDHGYAAKNAIYTARGVELAVQAARAACARADVEPSAIDHIFFISTTGIATPSIDAHLFNRLHLKPSIVRTPIWGLGCGGGVAGLARAADWLRAYPERTALVISLELCSLTFIRNDLSKSNFIATALFGDGCGAALLAGDQHPAAARGRLSIQAGASVTWPDSLDVMGWEVADEGLRVVFSRSIPQIVNTLTRPAIVDFLAGQGVCLDQIRFFLSHPGGAKVIQAYQQALELQEEQTSSMKQVLAAYGNISSATVFFVLDHFLHQVEYRPGDLILSTALGPGFSSEMILGRCL